VSSISGCTVLLDICCIQQDYLLNITAQDTNLTGVMEKVAYIFCGEQGRRPEYQFNYQSRGKPGSPCEQTWTYEQGLRGVEDHCESRRSPHVVLGLKRNLDPLRIRRKR
jgi:hypothetical protein